MTRAPDCVLDTSALLALRGNEAGADRVHQLLTAARKKDLQVVCWTVNHSAHMRLLMSAGVDGIMSDYPDRLLATEKKAKRKT